ncbi:MAG TPA: Fe-S cluster assembly protein SufD [Gemmatimonadales bacterium]|nr:Fe-S cluster assembly protein SufD [Gemmatimonadales bacterium]
MTALADAVPFADLAADVQRSGDEPGHISQLRREGVEHFARVGIPTSKNEEWRFTPVRALGTTRFTAAGPSPALTPADIAPFLGAGSNGPLLVLVDGRYNAGLSRPGALRSAGSLKEYLAADATGATVFNQIVPLGSTPFSALNTALWSDGIWLHLRRDEHVAQPIEILHVTTSAAAGAAIVPRALVLAERGASAAIVESFVSLADTAHFTNACMEIAVAEGARVEHVRVQHESGAATHIGITGVRQASDSHYRSCTLHLGARLGRHDLQTRLAGQNIETLLYGLYLVSGEQLADNHTTIFHDEPHCNSWEVYKGVLAGHARGVFNGKVIVQPAAQKTDAKQTNRNLLLSDHARVDTKPQLEIFADDVKCTHGATVGKLDEQQRFYLRSRGIAGDAAQNLLLWAFVADVLESVTLPDVREMLARAVRTRLAERMMPGTR